MNPNELCKQQMIAFVNGYLDALENSSRPGVYKKESTESSMKKALYEFESLSCADDVKNREQTTKIAIVTEAIRAKASVTIPELPKISVNHITRIVSIQYSPTATEKVESKTYLNVIIFLLLENDRFFFHFFRSTFDRHLESSGFTHAEPFEKTANVPG